LIQNKRLKSFSLITLCLNQSIILSAYLNVPLNCMLPIQLEAFVGRLGHIKNLNRLYYTRGEKQKHTG